MPSAKGFLGANGSVHDSNSPKDKCATCATDPDALVHNIHLPEFYHSTHFLDDVHAWDLWLPYLWGYVPAEFSRYLDDCWKAAYLRQEGFWQELERVEDDLRNATYGWTAPLTVEGYLAHQLEIEIRRKNLDLRGRSHMEIVEEAFSFLYVITTEARAEARKSGLKDELLERAL